jgi:hypothetical protein
MNQKPSWAESPDWAVCLGFAFSGDDYDFYSEIYGEENVKVMKRRWCYFSYPNPIGIVNLEYRPEDNIIKKYMVWLWAIEGIGILIPVESPLSKIKLQTYYNLLIPSLKRVDVYTESQFKEQKFSWSKNTPVKVEYADYNCLTDNLQRQFTKLTKEYNTLSNRLSNPNFEEKAPKDIVLKCQTDYERVKAELILIESKLKLSCKSH